MPFESAFIHLLCVATAVAILARRHQVPDTVAIRLLRLASGDPSEPAGLLGSDTVQHATSGDARPSASH